MTAYLTVVTGQQIRTTSQLLSDALYDLYSPFLMVLANGVGLSWSTHSCGSSGLI